MRIWLSNSRTVLAQEREFFAAICDQVMSLRGARRVAERFQLLAALAALPWLDQPRALEPTRLIFEIQEAWQDLWTIPLTDFRSGAWANSAAEPFLRDPGAERAQSRVLGQHLARPFHELIVFAASAGAKAHLLAATHRRLVTDVGARRAWRVIQGGRSDSPR